MMSSVWEMIQRQRPTERELEGSVFKTLHKTLTNIREEGKEEEEEAGTKNEV